MAQAQGLSGAEFGKSMPLPRRRCLPHTLSKRHRTNGTHATPGQSTALAQEQPQYQPQSIAPANFLLTGVCLSRSYSPVRAKEIVPRFAILLQKYRQIDTYPSTK